MDFGSSFVYLNNSDSEEEIAEGMLHGRAEHMEQQQTLDDASGGEGGRAKEAKAGFLSSIFRRSRASSSSSAAPGAPSAAAPAAARVRRVRKQDTNVLSVAFDGLADVTEETFHTGDAVVCQGDGCAAVLSAQSTVTPVEGHISQHVWACEFCEHANTVDIFDAEELPQADSVDYLLASAAQQVGGAAAEAGEANVVFCIDTSGSMCVAQVMPKSALKIRVSAARQAELDALEAFREGNASQRMRGERGDMQYVSRMQAIQAAIDAQLSALPAAAPDARVGLVTFSDQVTLIGDGDVGSEVHLAGSKLDAAAYDDMWAKGKAAAPTKRVAESAPALAERVLNLAEAGQTALGPALVASVAMASTRPGSRVIACTDGMANVGCGSNEQGLEESEAFYRRVGEQARDAGVQVSVLSIKGDEAGMENLGIVADATGGEVDIVDPRDMASKFSSLLENSVIALNVQARIVLHKALAFRNEQGAGGRELVRNVGNVTAETAETVEFSVRRDARELLGGADGGRVPFQVQISFTTRSGQRCMRVITQMKDITADRAVAEKAAHVGVLGLNSVRQSARHAEAGNLTKARAKHLKSNRLIERVAASKGDALNAEESEQISKWNAQAPAMEATIADAMEELDMDDLRCDSDDSGDEAAPSERVAYRSERRVARRSKRKDKSAASMYQFKSAKKTGFM